MCVSVYVTLLVSSGFMPAFLPEMSFSITILAHQKRGKFSTSFFILYFYDEEQKNNTFYVEVDLANSKFGGNLKKMKNRYLMQYILRAHM